MSRYPIEGLRWRMMLTHANNLKWVHEELSGMTEAWRQKATIINFHYAGWLSEADATLLVQAYMVESA